MSDNQAATIVGGVVGAVVGTFLGGQTQLGFALGAAIGGALVPPEQETIKAPRLDNTDVQSDQIGTALPWVYGTQRVPAFRSWIENNELREEIETSGGGGKGGPSKPEREIPRYFATFMAILSEVPPGKTYKVRRVWLDSVKVVDARPQEDRTAEEFVGELLASNTVPQGAGAGEISLADDQADTVGAILFLDGSEDQKPPSRIVADRGKAPGYRGVTALYFEDLALEDFGRRIPKVTAEIVEGGTGDNLVVAFEADQTEISSPPLWIEDGVLHANWGENGEQHGVETQRDNPVFVDYGLTPTGQIADRETNDVATVSAFDGHDVGQTEGLFGNSSTFRHLILESFQVRPDRIIRLYYYADFNGDPLRLAVAFRDEFNLANPVGIWDFINKTDESSTIESLGMAATPDRQNLFVFTSFSDGTRSYTRYDPTVGFSGGEIESGNIIFSEDSFPKIAEPGGERLGSDFAAMPMVDKSLQQLWFYNRSNNLWIFEKQGRDYVQVYKQSDIELGNQPSAIVDNGTLFALSGGKYRVVTSGLIANQTTTLSGLITDLCERAGLEPSEFDASQVTSDVRGYVAKDTTAKSAISQLRQILPFDIRDSGYTLEFIPRGQSSVMTLTDEDLQAHEPGQDMPATVKITRKPETDMPRESEIQYSDVNRRLEGNLQRQTRQSTKAEGKISTQIPLALTAQEAVRAADVLLKDSWASQMRYNSVGSLQLLALEPADVVTLDTTPVKGDARIERIDDGAPGLRQIELVPDGPGQYASAAEGEGGDAGGGGISVPGTTRAVPMDLAPITGEGLQAGHYYAIGGTSSGWPGGSLIEYRDSSVATLSTETASATFGSANTVLGDGPTTIWDRSNTLNISLGSGSLASATDNEVLEGANVLAVSTAERNLGSGDWEIIQFRDAVQESDGTWTLSKLLRGRAGTERLTDQHTGTAARVVVLTDRQGIGFVSRDASSIDDRRGFAGVTIGRLPPANASRSFTYRGRNLTPLSPVQVSGSRNSSDDLTITWERRTRSPGNFLGLDTAPLSEDTEEYEVDILDGSTVVRTIGTTSKSATYTASEQQADFGSVQSSVTVRVYQISAAVGRGWPAEEVV